MSDKGENISVLKEMFHNKDIRRGFLCFTVALILAFAAVTPRLDTDSEKGEVTPEGDEQNFPLLISYRTRDSTLRLNYTSPNSSDRAIIHIRNNEDETLKNVSLSSNSVPIEIDLTAFDSDPAYISVNISSGILRYSQTIAYTRHPYSLVSLPAAFLTLLGMVYAFKGKGALLAVIKENKEAKEAKKEMEKKKKEKEDKEGEKDSDSEQQVSSSGENEKGVDEVPSEDRSEEESEAGHIDFMGVPGGLGGEEEKK